MRCARLQCVLLLLVVGGASVTHAFELFCGRRNCFEVLGLNRTVSQSQIKRAYRTLALELHPDRNLNKSPEEQEEQADKFKVIQTAYEAVKDNDSRTEYEDFLDHPHKYYLAYASGFAGGYAPESDVRAVVIGLLVLFSVLHWANMSLNYSSLQRRVRSSPQYKKQIGDLVSRGQAKTPQEADELLQNQVTAAEKPHWKKSLPILLLKLPFKMAKLFFWGLHWLIAYRLLKRDYSRPDQEYLTRRELDIPQRHWDSLPTEERDDLVDRQLWIKDNLDEFIRSKRVDLNRKGGRKKPRQRRGQPTIDETFVD